MQPAGRCPGPCRALPRTPLGAAPDPLKTPFEKGVLRIPENFEKGQVYSCAQIRARLHGDPSPHSGG